MSYLLIIKLITLKTTIITINNGHFRKRKDAHSLRATLVRQRHTIQLSEELL